VIRRRARGDAEAGARFTTTPHWVLTIFGGLAEFERSLIVARTGEGRRRAKAAGGRPSASEGAARRERSGGGHRPSMSIGRRSIGVGGGRLRLRRALAQTAV
jgi:hypothetical protein